MDKRSLIFITCVTLAFLAIQTYFSPPPKTESQQKTVAEKKESQLPYVAANSEESYSSKSDETFYVMENEYQQLVFSTRGGSLAEINLPFESKSNPLSIVKEIDIDREILADAPLNAQFPLRPYYTADGVYHTEGSKSGYYPLLRRPIVRADGTFKSQVSPEYYGLAVMGDQPQSARVSYKMTRFEPDLIQFRGSVNGQTVTKTYRFTSEKKGPYCIDLNVTVEGDGNPLWIASGVPDVELVSGSYTPLLRYQIARPGGPDVETIDLPKKEMVQVSNLNPNWISNNNGFLGLIMDPLNAVAEGYKVIKVDGATLPTRLTLIDPAHKLYSAESYPGYITLLPLRNNSSIDFRIFAGPFDHTLLKQLDATFDLPLEHYNPEYVSAQSIQGWFSFISQPFAKFLFFLMQLFYSISGSWAVSIILLTIALRAMMYPLNSWSIKSSIKMQEISPKIKAVQERYKKDPKRAQMEVMNLYRESGINPLLGCLPVLLQMPFLIGMFYLLKSSFPLRGAVFIPGWIDDLAAPDVLFSWGQPLWFIGNEFHLLPILMGVTMFIQQRITSKLPKDASQLSDAQKQQKMTGNLMSVLFTVMFYNFPSGLNIYFMFSTILGVLQQMYMMKKMKQPIVAK